MSDEKKPSPMLSTIPGIKPVDIKQLEPFLREMKDTVIPDILKAVEKRRLSAAESRQKQLKC